MFKKSGAAILSVIMAFAIVGCGAGSGDSSDKDIMSLVQSATKQKWVDSNITGSIKPEDEIRLQDDFAAAVNKDWKLEMGDKYYGVFQDASDAVLEKKKKAVTDGSISGIDAEVLRDYYDLASDWEYRNSQGVEPLLPYINDIDSIESLDDFYAFVKDLKRNPLAIGPVKVETYVTYHSEKYPNDFVTIITPPDLTLTDMAGNGLYSTLNSTSSLQLYEERENKILYILGRLGYSESDAEKIFSNALKWEKKVNSANDINEIADVEDVIVAREEASEMTRSFPLDDILNSWGFEDARSILIPHKYAKKLSSLCTERNLRKMKDFLIVRYCLISGKYLDREALDRFGEFEASRSQAAMDFGKSEEQKEDSLMFDLYIAESGMAGAMNKIYVENYFDDSVTGELTGMTQDVIDGFKVIFNEEEWLSEEGKKACIDKLSSISIHIAYQSFDILDYSSVNFPSKNEGGSFLEAYYEASRYTARHNGLVAGKDYDSNFWDPLNSGLSTTETNAFYNPSTNGIYICAGICEFPAYSPDMTYEEKLAGVFSVVGHEITHGFDKNGSIFDKNGFKNSLLSYEDQSAFNDRNDMVAAYYSVMTPFPEAGLYNGTQVNGEATADMGGIRVTLYLASKVPDFDYDLYFRSYARMYRENMPLEAEKWYLSDVHPLAFYRVNVGLQQFDEFYETYGITENDNMYLDPEKRIKVW